MKMEHGNETEAEDKREISTGKRNKKQDEKRKCSAEFHVSKYYDEVHVSNNVTYL